MSISALSSNLITDLSQQIRQNPFQQIQQDFKQLSSALQSGNFSDAQSAYSSIQQLLLGNQTLRILAPARTVRAPSKRILPRSAKLSSPVTSVKHRVRFATAERRRGRPSSASGLDKRGPVRIDLVADWIERRAASTTRLRPTRQLTPIR
jgi:hypothetical protein